MRKYDIPYCIFATTQSEVIHLGRKEDLEYPDFPKSIINDHSSITGLTEYLNANIQPRILSQGNVRSIIGMMQNGDIFAFFVNTKSSASEHYNFAKLIYQETRN